MSKILLVTALAGGAAYARSFSTRAVATIVVSGCALAALAKLTNGGKTLMPSMTRRIKVHSVAELPKNHPLRRITEQLEAEMDAPAAGPMAVYAQEPAKVGAFLQCFFREAMCTTGDTTRRAREIVALGVSQSNECSFCTTGHALMRDALASQKGGEGGAAESEQALLDWAKSLRRKDSPVPIPAALSAAEQRGAVAELLGVAALFHLTNRVVDIFVVKSPLEAVPSVMTGAAEAMMRAMVRPGLLKQCLPGSSIDIAFGGGWTGEPALPASLPLSLHRDVIEVLQHRPHLLRIVTLVVAAAREAGTLRLSSPAVSVVRDFIDHWDGSPPSGGMSSKWATRAAERSDDDVSMAEKKKIRFVLLAALAPFQITDQEVAELIEADGQEATLQLTFFAASEAMCRILEISCARLRAK